MLRLARTQSALRRFIYTDSWPEHTLREWLRSKERTQQLRDVVSAYRLKRLIEFLPTRNPNDFDTLDKLTSGAPQKGDSVLLGHHLVVLPENYKDQLLRPDGSTSWHAPPSPWTRRQCSGGKIWSAAKSPLLVGLRFVQKRTYLDKKWACSPEKFEEGHGPPSSPSLLVKQKVLISQWHSRNTELLTEERVTEYHTEPYDPSQIKTSSLIPPQSGTLSFAFVPTPFTLYNFSSLCDDKHRIHFDLEYAKQEGYPDLVVQVQLQLILILETLAAHLPEGMSIRGVDYTVVNPLFAGREIKIYQHWLHNPDLSARTVSDMPSEPLISSDSENVQTTTSDHKRNPWRRERNAKRKRIALLWTAADNGVVGVVAKVGLQKRPKTETLDSLPWTMDKNQGYLVQRTEPQVATIESRDATGNISRPHPNKILPSHMLSRRLQESVRFDPSGQPITGPPSPPATVNIGSQWPLSEEDAAAMEQERLDRRKKAVDVKSQELFERLFGGVD